MEITFEKLQEKRDLVIKTYGTIEDPESKSQAKIKEWDEKVIKELNKVKEKYKQEFIDKLTDVNIDNALEIEITKDGKTVKQLVRGEKGEYTYSKEGEKAKVKAINQLSNEIDERMYKEVITFEPYLIDLEFLKETPEDIIKELKEIFIK